MKASDRTHVAKFEIGTCEKCGFQTSGKQGARKICGACDKLKTGELPGARREEWEKENPITCKILNANGELETMDTFDEPEAQSQTGVLPG